MIVIVCDGKGMHIKSGNMFLDACSLNGIITIP